MNTKQELEPEPDIVERFREEARLEQMERLLDQLKKGNIENRLFFCIAGKVYFNLK